MSQLLRLCDVYLQCILSVSRQIYSDQRTNHAVSPQTVSLICPEGQIHFYLKQLPGSPFSVSRVVVLFSLEALESNYHMHRHTDKHTYTDLAKLLLGYMSLRCI